MTNRFWEQSEQGVWVGESGYPGPNVAIMGGVHGDEGTGPLVVDSLLETPPRIEEGTITLIMGNPLACDTGVHYLDSNLNRCFVENPSSSSSGYESERAELLVPYLKNSSALLDIHDTSSPCEPFLICERNALDTALRVGRTSTSGMTIAFGFSAMEPGGSDDFMYRQGKEGICHETGDMKYPHKNLPGALEVTSRFLIVHGLLDGVAPIPAATPTMIEVYRSIVCTDDFEWAELFSNFQKLEENQLLATSSGQEIRADAGDVMLFPARELVSGDEACELARTIQE